jgi:hypothetical protein
MLGVYLSSVLDSSIIQCQHSRGEGSTRYQPVDRPRASVQRYCLSPDGIRVNDRPLSPCRTESVRRAFLPPSIFTDLLLTRM